MFNKILKFSLISSLLVSLPMIANIAVIKDNPWEFMEYNFIIKPEKDLNNWKNFFIKLGAGAAVGFGGFKLASWSDEATIRNGILNSASDRWKNAGSVAYKSTLTTLPAVLTFIGVHNTIKNSLDFRVFSEFIKSWPKYRVHTPSELYESLDQAYDVYKTDASRFGSESKEVIDFIKERIYKKFGKKYDYNGNFFDARIFTSHVNFDFGSVLRGIAEIIKALGKNNRTDNRAGN